MQTKEKINSLKYGERYVYYTGRNRPNNDFKQYVGDLYTKGTHILNLQLVSRDYKNGSIFNYIITRKNKPFIGR